MRKNEYFKLISLLKFVKMERNRCRCCYSVTACGKLVEVDTLCELHQTYVDMITETFCISMSHVLLYSNICELCMVRLRDASNFRRQVLCTEERFQHALSTDNHDNVAETDYFKEEEDSDRFNYGGDESNDPDYTDEDDKPLRTVFPQTRPKRCKMSAAERALALQDRVKTEFDKQPRLNMDKLLQVNKYVRKLIEKNGDDFELPPVGRSVVSAEKQRVLQLRVPRFKPLRTGRTRAIKTDPDNATGKSCLSDEKKAARKIIIQNALAILINTTACPFVYFHSNFKCFFCRLSFFDFNLLKAHTSEEHANLTEEARKVRSFRDMLMVDITGLSCRRCDRPFEDIEAIKMHLIETHSVAIDLKHKDDIAAFKLTDQGFSCHLCGEQFHVFRNLSLHLNKHYANYMCDICGKPFISFERYKNHEVTHTDGRFKCSKCDQVFNTIRARAHHYVNHHRMVRYGCPMCPERFEKYLERTVHMSNVHKVTYNFKCPHCAKEFFHKPHLRAHITNIHLPRVKKVECPECAMRFADNHSLARHMVSHTGEKMYGCRLCGKRYGRKYSLNEHLRAHAKLQARGRAAAQGGFQ